MRRFFALFTIMAMLLASCENEPTTPIEPAKPEIELQKSGIITMPASGGEAEILYTIINPEEGLTLEAVADVEWITDIAVAESVTFTVERNNGEQRVGVVTLRYGEAEMGVGVQQNEALASGDVRISITSERKTIFESTGGKGTLTYMLECEEEGAMPEVTTDAEWITIDAVEEGQVSYTVARSLEEQKRTGHITLTYNGKSAEATIEQKAAELIPILTANSTMVRTGETITFSVEYAEEDVTSAATIYDYYTKEEVANPYTPTEAAERVFYATYNNRTSKVLTINVISADAPAIPEDSAPESFDFRHQMLVVDHTGVTCGYCPNMKSLLRSLENSPAYKNKINIVYSYSFSSSEVCYSAAATTLWQYYKNVCSTSNVGMHLTGYPSATFNYCVDYAASPNTAQGKVDELWQENTSASIALAATIKDGKVIVSTEVKSAVAQNIHLALWILEDDIYARQSGGSAEWMNTHHNVLRECLTGASKDDISGVNYGYLTERNTMQRVYEFDLNKSSAWVEENFKVIAIISSPNENYDNRYEVLDSAICEIDGSVAHDYK